MTHLLISIFFLIPLTSISSSVSYALERPSQQAELQKLFTTPNIWLDQNSRPFDLVQAKKYKFMAFVLSYTSCTTLCPMISLDLKQLQKSMDDNTNFKFILISIDPKNDPPSKLKKYMKDHNLNEKYFTYIVSTDNLTAKLSSTLGIGFSDSAETSSHIEHSSQIAIYDQNLNKLGQIDISDGKVSSWKSYLKNIINTHK